VSRNMGTYLCVVFPDAEALGTFLCVVFPDAEALGTFLCVVFPDAEALGTFLCVMFPDAEALLGLATGHELEPLVIQEECDISQPAPSPRRKASELPVFETTTEVDDNLNDVSGVC